MNTDRTRPGSAREEAERLMAAGLATASTALHGVEANRQLRGFAEQMFGADRVRDLAAGLAGFVSGSGSSPTSGAAGDGPAGDGAAGDGAAGDGAAAGSAPGSSAAGSAPGSSAAGSPSVGLSTGSADCCVCPVCRLIAALRDPSPEFAERLATAAGDLAVGISGLLRALSASAPRPGNGAGDDSWRAATRATPSSAAAEEPPVAAPDEPARAATSKPVAKKATAKKATAKKAVAKKATAKKATAKKATAKKAVRKAVRKDPTDGPA